MKTLWTLIGESKLGREVGHVLHSNTVIINSPGEVSHVKDNSLETCGVHTKLQGMDSDQHQNLDEPMCDQDKAEGEAITPQHPPTVSQ